MGDTLLSIDSNSEIKNADLRAYQSALAATTVIHCSPEVKRSPNSPENPENPMAALDLDVSQEELSSIGDRGLEMVVQPEFMSVVLEYYGPDSLEVTQKWQGNGSTIKPYAKIPRTTLMRRKEQVEAAFRENSYSPQLAHDMGLVFYQLDYLDIAACYTAYSFALMRLTPEQRGSHRIDPNAFFSRTGSHISPIFKSLRIKSTILFAYVLRGIGANFEVQREFLALMNDFPDDETLLSIRDDILDKPAQEIGLIYRKQYPWLDSKLFTRDGSLLKKINRRHKVGTCRVLPLDKQPLFSNLEENDSITNLVDKSMQNFSKHGLGPLGIMAITPISKDEIVIINPTVASVPMKMLRCSDNCDACHGSLLPRYTSTERIKPPCGCKIEFCSQECLGKARDGYHRELCGKNFDWLHEICAGESDDLHYLFMRVVAIILSDFRRSKPLNANPLRHLFLRQLTGGYSDIVNMDFDWSMNLQVRIPAMILTTLGVDIFSDPNWSPTVIQTIFHRLTANSNRGISVCQGANVDPRYPYPYFYTSGIHPTFSFLNHKCEPNVEWFSAAFDNETASYKGADLSGKKETVDIRAGSSTKICRALKDIQAGEELTISYVSSDFRGERRRLMLAKYGIVGCECEFCCS